MIEPDANRVKELAFKVGFDLCGIAPADVIPEARQRFYAWLEKGYHAEMTYLERGPERRTDPATLLPGACSVVMLGLDYYQSNSSPVPVGHGRVSRYARGRDYHKVVGRMIGDFIQCLREEIGEQKRAEFKWYVDYGPVMERAYALRAGMGFIGRNGMLINRRLGSWFFLGTVVTSFKLAPDSPGAYDFCDCANCRRCVEACPTGAIVDDGLIDSGRCLSYLTVENPSRIPAGWAPRLGDTLFGCDVCQEVCPFNERVDTTAHGEFLPENGVGEFVDLRWLLSLKNRDDFLELAAGTPLTRPGLEGLQATARLISRNRPTAEADEPIR